MAADHPERVLGLHLVDAPVDRSAPDRLVEVVRTVRTDDQVVEQARAVVDRLGFVGVLAQDRAGFIVDALLLPHLNDAIAMLDSHYATADEIDTAMTRGCAYPMGPFELLDAIGLDVALATIDRLHAEFHEPSLQAQPLLRQLVGAGFSGREAGRGFHVHE